MTPIPLEPVSAPLLVVKGKGSACPIRGMATVRRETRRRVRGEETDDRPQTTDL
jgi:hypothetical protein